MDVLRRVFDVTVPLGSFLRDLLVAAQDRDARLRALTEASGTSAERSSADLENWDVAAATLYSHNSPETSSRSSGAQTPRRWGADLDESADQSTELRHLLQHAVVGLMLPVDDNSEQLDAGIAELSEFSSLTASSSAQSSRTSAFFFSPPAGRSKRKGGTLRSKQQPPIFAAAASNKEFCGDEPAFHKRRRRRARKRNSNTPERRGTTTRAARRERRLVLTAVSQIANLLNLSEGTIKARETRGELVGNCIRALLNNGSKDDSAPSGRNVLTLGFQKHTQQFGAAAAISGASMIHGVVSKHPNSMASILRHSECFRLLHEGVGDDVFTFLLTQLSVFLCVCDQMPAGLQTGTDSFVQLCGIQISALAKSARPQLGSGESSVAPQTRLRMFRATLKRGAVIDGNTRAQKRRRMGLVNDPSVGRRSGHTRRGKRGRGHRKEKAAPLDHQHEKKVFNVVKSKRSRNRRLTKGASKKVAEEEQVAHSRREAGSSKPSLRRSRLHEERPNLPTLNRNAVMYRFSHKNKPRNDFLFALCGSFAATLQETPSDLEQAGNRDEYPFHLRVLQRHSDALLRFIFSSKRRSPSCHVRDREGGYEAFDAKSVLSWVSESLSNYPKPMRRLRPLFARFFLRLAKHMGFVQGEALVRKNVSLFLLNIYCPLQENRDRQQVQSMTQAASQLDGEERISQRDFLARLSDTQLHRRFCTHRQVCLFVWTFLERVCPPEFGLKRSKGKRLGDNSRVFKRGVFGFVCLKKFERMSLPQLLAGIRTTELFLCDRSNAKMRSVLSHSSALSHRTKSFLVFLYFDLIFPLVKQFFYVTEIGDQRNRVVYYRKEVWAEIQRRAMRALVYDGPAVAVRKRTKRPRTSAAIAVPDVTKPKSLFKKLSRPEVVSILSQREFGYAVMRLLPKSLSADPSKTGVRPIMNFAKRGVRIPQGVSQRAHGLSINQILHNDFFILNREREASPEQFGSSVFNFDDIYERVASFRSSLDQELPLFMCSVDITRSFDTINQARVFGALEQLLRGGEGEKHYSILRWSVLKSLEGRLCPQYKKRAFEHTDLPPNFVDFLRQYQPDGSHAILTDSVQYPTESAQAVLQRECQLIFQNVIQHNGVFFKQIRGIAQGSVLSSHLCSLTYGELENLHLSDLSGVGKSTATSDEGADSKEGISASPQGLLVRFIDDFFYVSTSSDAVRSLITRLEAGFPEFGCTANAKKTKASVRLSSTRVNPGCIADGDATFLPWCGFLIDTKRLRFQHDFSRLTGSGMRDTLNIDTHAAPGRSLERKLLKFARSRCIPLLLDVKLNGADTVRLNIFHSFCACAIRFHIGVCALPRGPTPETTKQPSQGKPNKFFVRTVLNLVEMMYDYIQRALRLPVAVRMGCLCPVTRSEVRWLGYMAFIAMLLRKQSRHQAVLTVLRSRLKLDPALREVSTDREWRAVIDPARSRVFQEMEY